jgi:leucyl aminopeptidase
MKLALYTDDLRDAPVDLLALGVFSDEPDRGLAFAHLNRGVDGALEQACRDEDFRGRPGQSLVFNVATGIKARRVLVVGLGDRDRYDADMARRMAGVAARLAKNVSAASLAVVLTVKDTPTDGGAIELVEALAEGVILGGYAFGTYLTKDARASRLSDVRIAFAAEDVQGVKGAALRASLSRGQAIAEAIGGRIWSTNRQYAHAWSWRIADSPRLILVLGPKDMEKQGMGPCRGRPAARRSRGSST